MDSDSFESEMVEDSWEESEETLTIEVEDENEAENQLYHHSTCTRMVGIFEMMDSLEKDFFPALDEYFQETLDDKKQTFSVRVLRDQLSMWMLLRAFYRTEKVNLASDPRISFWSVSTIYSSHKEKLYELPFTRNQFPSYFTLARGDSVSSKKDKRRETETEWHFLNLVGKEKDQASEEDVFASLWQALRCGQLGTLALGQPGADCSESWPSTLHTLAKNTCPWVVAPLEWSRRHRRSVFIDNVSKQPNEKDWKRACIDHCQNVTSDENDVQQICSALSSHNPRILYSDDTHLRARERMEDELWAMAWVNSKELHARGTALAHDQNCWYHWAVLTTITDDRCKSFEDAVYALLKTVQRKINEGLEINCDRSVSTFFAFLVIFCSRYFEKVPDVDTFLYFKTLLKLPYAILAGDLSVVDLYIRSIYDPAIGQDICEAAAKVLCKVWLDQEDDVDEWKHIQRLDDSISALDPGHISLKFYVILEALENDALHSLKQFCDVIQAWGIIQSSDGADDDDVELVRSHEYGRWIECVEKVLQSGIQFVKSGDLDQQSNLIDMDSFVSWMHAVSQSIERRFDQGIPTECSEGDLVRWDMCQVLLALLKAFWNMRKNPRPIPEESDCKMVLLPTTTRCPNTEVQDELIADLFDAVTAIESFHRKHGSEQQFLLDVMFSPLDDAQMENHFECMMRMLQDLLLHRARYCAAGVKAHRTKALRLEYQLYKRRCLRLLDLVETSKWSILRLDTCADLFRDSVNAHVVFIGIDEQLGIE